MISTTTYMCGSSALVSSLSIKVENLGLRFYKNPNQAFTIKGICQKLFERHYEGDDTEKNSMYRWIWRDLNFEICDGDIIAVMGPNGEGKTTLLRVLAGLLAADEGSVQVRYRPYLLSAGLGFRDELNGYENIRLGGLFLGIPLQQIKEKTREIAEFAELSEEALQKPVKYYSDGMRARLVFSVATCSNQKILFLDEILGAGDVGFQKKAKARMDELMKSARTIVVVSHSKQFVLETATRAMLLYQGQMVAFGDTAKVVDEYERACTR